MASSPFGPLITKGYNFGGLFVGSGGSSRIRVLQNTGKTTVREQDKQRLAFRTEADPEGWLKGSACSIPWNIGDLRSGDMVLQNPEWLPDA